MLDACVLYQGKVTDFLLCLAEAGLFDPVWSERIQDEWTRNLATKLPADKVEYRRSTMDQAYPGAMCPVDASSVVHTQNVCLNAKQRADAHVLTAAIASGADFIVTHSVRDFWQILLDRFHVVKITPDDFCLELFAADGAGVAAGARAHRLSTKRSNFDVPGYLAFLGDRAGLPKIAQALAGAAADV